MIEFLSNLTWLFQDVRPDDADIFSTESALLLQIILGPLEFALNHL